MSHKYLFDQNDPAKICVDRPQRTSEIHTPNDFYGNASVLKRYAGFPGWYSLKAVLEHGVTVRDNMWDVDRNAILPVNFANSETRAELQTEVSGKLSIPVGFAFLYAKQLLQQMHPQAPDRRGTVVFPSHSTHFIKSKSDHSRMADFLRNLPEKYHPVSICTYWKNYLEGDHLEYQKQGFQILSAGHMFDADFQLRLYDICRRHKYAASNVFGSHLPISISSGCRYFFVKADSENDVPDEYQGALDCGTKGLKHATQTAYSLFSGAGEETTPEQQEFASNMIGENCLKTPAELRRLIINAEMLDKFYQMPKAAGTPGNEHLTPFFARKRARKLAKRQSRQARKEAAKAA